MKEVYIVSAVRTPFGSFGGKLAGLTAVELGSFAIKGALEKAGVDPKEVDEVIMGNVISANLGQAPARQASIGAGIGYNVPCTTVNKVCSSGMKAVMFAAQSIMTGQNDVMVAGGMESMSNAPFYIPKARFGYKYGNGELIDGLVRDGLHEVYYDFPMGNCAENTAKTMKITREEQDAYAIQSYTRSAEAWKKGAFKDEVIPVSFKGRKGETVIIDEDEEFRNVIFDKIPSLRPVFDKEGTVTAANASTMNDGASALVLMSKEKVQELGLKPIAKILGFADAAQDPIWFTTAPSLAIPKAIKNAGLTENDIDFYEINEAFAAVAIANQRQLNLDMDKLNVNGGAVALGHPLGASGARIIATLHSVLQQNEGKIGVAGICNGGGGASAIVIERL
ncbi:acetyl-CoA acetyltransferase [Rhodonellum psychrophilum GCM71 = DSM 17998]|uniref:acetyl-CoA C-acetyltransferase n=2 Tax=Rhodonellum TaxID=336827 RepID=U5BVM3_9BACT|nr:MULTISPECIES: acetyl-CoA C-acyltransferase [Rhodonellum]ERM81609.1 acetyl-CoA acetyltransferase [Rhodonellum psychrophilum GCM71 = DSM 17998]MDO9552922.1 acetyl-CoA C-acyltransferase [Rhodonellum sp.]SDZ33606.1 acetyl-CoA C-acetyltransferase [Rhodonellum ikkaensis]